MAITPKWSLLVVLALALNLGSHFVAASIRDCEYGQTIRLSLADSVNGSAYFQGELIPDDLIGPYDYIVGSQRDDNVRACICKLKNCIRLCCRAGRFNRTSTPNCAAHDDPDIYYDPRLAIRDHNHGLRYVDVSADGGEFFFQPVRLRCSSMYPESIWELQEDGLLRVPGGSQTRDYCFAPVLDVDTGTYSLKPFICVAANTKLRITRITTFLMIISAILMAAINVKYMCDPKAGSLQHNCEAFYVFWLTLAFVLSAAIKAGLLYPGIFVGCLLYYSACSTFACLSIVSYNLFVELRAAVRGTSVRTVFSTYLVWATVIPMVCTIGVLCKYGLLNDHAECMQNCWSQVYPMQVFCYLYVPVAVMVLFCLVCCSHIVCSYYILPETPRFRLWARIILFMSSLWALDVVSFFLIYAGYDEHDIAAIFINVSNIMNANQGIVIFVLFLEHELHSLWQRSSADFQSFGDSFEFTEYYYDSLSQGYDVMRRSDTLEECKLTHHSHMVVRAV